MPASASDPPSVRELDIAAEGGVSLRGTLTLPEAAGPAPAALLLSGSGPLDRDSNMRDQRLDIASALASALAAHGVGSLRFDKRGVGASSGDYMRTGFAQETRDAAAALDALRSAGGVDGDRLSVAGHSVGATIASRLAASGAGLAGAVLLSGQAQTGAEIMRWQSERIAGTLRGVSRLFGRRFLRKQAGLRQRLLASTDDVLRVGRQEFPARWFREYMAYDPAGDLRAIRCPVLAITGRSDVQVDAGDVARIGELVGGPFTGETPDGLSHLLRTHPGAPGIGTYRAQLRHPVDADLLERVATWTAGLSAR